jgi:DNA-binding PadR family transcriptional regulator
VGKNDPRDARPRRTYRGTEKGQRALEKWLRSQRPPNFEFRDEGRLRLFFADALPEEDAIALVKPLRRAPASSARVLSAVPEDRRPLA